MYANCNDTPVLSHRHTCTVPDDSVVSRLMACVNGCFEADGPDRTWSEMSWDFGRRRRPKQNISLCFFTLSLPWFAISSSCSLKKEVYSVELITSFTESFLCSPSLTIYTELHTWVIESMLFIKSIIHPSIAVFHSHLLFGFTSLISQLGLFLLTLLGLVLFSSLSPLLLSSYLVSLPPSPTLRRAWQIISVHETR